ncbi:ankyrin repeat domain-containing protein [Fulvivirgaceae bacterium BMA10]|uniref:Ankyrin repeat domain-containing protein n=1 Tax=Splendidivirga corallicola TaxID=3051826 RepID=A0ABT8L115_9BACT|nr:ankyrin repeat domain-containing protein [Fulvivirgaceae bacterium BMA10]
MTSQQHPQFEEALKAIDSGNASQLKALLKDHPELVKAQSMTDDEPYSGYFYRATLLHHVAGNPVRGPLPDNIVEIAQILLDAGADIEAPCGGGPTQPNTHGGTTLGLLASGRTAENQGLAESLMEVLLKAGAKMDSNGTGGIMWISLYHTVENKGQRDVARMLYDRGHGVDLCFAAGLGLLDQVKSYFLEDGSLKQGADHYYKHHRRTNKEATTEEILEDAFLFACINGELEVAEYLLAKNININAKRPWGPELITPLHGAAWAGWKHIAQFLIANGADPYCRDKNHNATPVSWAQYCKKPEVMEYLLEDENNLDLFDALEFGKVNRFEALFGDTDPNAALMKGESGVFLRVAAYHGYSAIVRFLLEKGADPNLSNSKGETALFWARKNNHTDVIQILEDETHR